MSVIKTQRIKSTTDKIIDLDDYISINVLKWKDSKWKTLCPYYMKTDGEEENENEGGIIFENFYQGSKVYDYVYDIEVYPHARWKGNEDYLWWKYECRDKREGRDKIYDIETEKINMINYRRWRDSLWSCENPIRYPNGINRRQNTQFTLIRDKNGNRKTLDYLESRKDLYVKEYIRLAKKTDEYHELLDNLLNGENLLICEIDVPSKGKRGEYIKDVDENGNCDMTIEKLELLINDPSEAFGHGLALSLSLLKDFEYFIDK